MLEYKKEIDIQKDENKRKWITGEKLLFLGKEYEIEPLNAMNIII